MAYQRRSGNVYTIEIALEGSPIADIAGTMGAQSTLEDCLNLPRNCKETFREALAGNICLRAPEHS